VEKRWDEGERGEAFPRVNYTFGCRGSDFYHYTIVQVVSLNVDELSILYKSCLRTRYNIRLLARLSPSSHYRTSYFFDCYFRSKRFFFRFCYICVCVYSKYSLRCLSTLRKPFVNELFSL